MTNLDFNELVLAFFVEHGFPAEIISEQNYIYPDDIIKYVMIYFGGDGFMQIWGFGEEVSVNVVDYSTDNYIDIDLSICDPNSLEDLLLIANIFIVDGIGKIEGFFNIY